MSIYKPLKTREKGYTFDNVDILSTSEFNAAVDANIAASVTGILESAAFTAKVVDSFESTEFSDKVAEIGDGLYQPIAP